MTTPTPVSFADAIALELDGDDLVGHVAEGWDVFGIPHGGYLLALAGNAVLTASGAPDLFTITTHYLRKASYAPIRFRVERVGGSRRFTTVTATATQGDDVVLSIMASVGDRSSIEGPAWRHAEPWDAGAATLSPRAGTPEMEAGGMPTPGVAHRSGERIDRASLGFATGAPDGSAEIRAVTDLLPADQLGALVACDVTPPAVWNAVGATGWVPTVELTAHVRARTGIGPLAVVASTHHVEGGFLDEDALVHDSEGRLIVQSRQLARYTA
ncbi:thioesterase family protein [Nocardioides acrostichi]|uniref:Thioesterase family protein n=1 Tax=Nocardioides acrostichi TaxID=2784339 RepID=A0A930Y6K7_9ACTN|nr:thioesterase family protein [Nocardioides acrostichi]MBF4161046.1 thioesterase family protein [Nocardioides acrostichi]